LAFTSSVRAGIDLERTHALAAVAAQYERALQLWEHVPEPAAAAGMTRAELILCAARTTPYSLQSTRDIALVESALAALDEHASPEQRAMVLERLERANWKHQRGAQAAAAYERAVALLATGPPRQNRRSQAGVNTDDQDYRSRGYSVALRVEADRAAVPRPSDTQLAAVRKTADRLIEEARQIRTVADALLPEPAVWLVTAEAEYSRVYGRDDPQTWAGVADQWERIGQPYQAAVARYRQADALLRHRGDRGQAATAARAARDTAQRLGAEPLVAD
jgi:hypothetical protein